MNGRFQMQGGKNWILPKEMNANRFFWDAHWLEIWSNHFCPSMVPNGGSVARDSVLSDTKRDKHYLCFLLHTDIADTFVLLKPLQLVMT